MASSTARFGGIRDIMATKTLSLKESGWDGWLLSPRTADIFWINYSAIRNTPTPSTRSWLSRHSFAGFDSA